MEVYKQILTKNEINVRFIMAINAILDKKMVNSKVDLAESLNVKPSKFSEILNGRMNVGVDMIATLCDLYRISPDWILMSRGNNMFRETYKMPKIWVDDEPSDLDTTLPSTKEVCCSPCMKRTVSRWRSSSATSTACASRGQSSARIRPTIFMPFWSGKTS